MSSLNEKEQLNGESHDLTKNGVKDEGVDDKNTEQRPKVKSQISMVDLDRIVENSLRDIDVYDDDGDDDDPDILNELSQIIHPGEVRDAVAVDLSITATNSVPAEVPALLNQRIEMYKIAEANATTANESGRARRFARGLSTLETMLKEVVAGKNINMDDIPPEVMTKLKHGSDSTPSEVDK